MSDVFDEQTPQTLRPYVLEEAYEVVDALDRGDPREVCAELGDLLLQVVFQAELWSERSEFHVGDVARAIADKLERRLLAAALERDHAEQVQRVHMIAIEREDVAAGSLGCIDLPCTEMLHRRRE